MRIARIIDSERGTQQTKLHKFISTEHPYFQKRPFGGSRKKKRGEGEGDPQPRLRFRICRRASKRSMRFGAEFGTKCRGGWFLRDWDEKKEQEEEEKEVEGGPRTSNVEKCQAAIQPARETRGRWENYRGKEKVADGARKQRQCVMWPLFQSLCWHGQKYCDNRGKQVNGYVKISKPQKLGSRGSAQSALRPCRTLPTLRLCRDHRNAHYSLGFFGMNIIKNKKTASSPI